MKKTLEEAEFHRVINGKFAAVRQILEATSWFTEIVSKEKQEKVIKSVGLALGVDGVKNVRNVKHLAVRHLTTLNAREDQIGFARCMLEH